jgi:hypothetical protein
MEVTEGSTNTESVSFGKYNFLPLYAIIQKNDFSFIRNLIENCLDELSNEFGRINIFSVLDMMS